MSNNNNPPPDRVFAVAKRRLQRDSSSGSTSSAGSATSASNAFSFGTAPMGFNTSQAEPFRFGSPTTPAFGDPNSSPFGQPTTTAAVAPPITTQPFQFGAAGNNAFQFGSANTNTSVSRPTSSSGFQFGVSNSNQNFGFGMSTKGDTQTTISPFQFGSSITSNAASPFGGSSAVGSTPMNTFQFGTSTQNAQSPAESFAFGTAPQRQETIQIDDDMSDDDANINNALVLANQRTAFESSPNKPAFSFGSTPPQKDGSESSSSSTPFQQKQQQQQQASEFFSILSNQQSSSTPSSPLVFVSPSSAEQINIQKPSTQPAFNRSDESKSSLSYGTALANLEDPFDSSPIQKTQELENEKKDSEEKEGSSVVVIEDLDGAEGAEEESRDQTSKEPIDEDKEYQVVEPEEANVESENKMEKEDTVEVSTEHVDQPSKDDPKSDEPSKTEKKDVTSSNDATPIEIGDSNEESGKEKEETAQTSNKPDKEKTDNQTSQKTSDIKTPDEKEKPTGASSPAQEAAASSSDVLAQKSKSGDSEEVKKATPLFTGFNFTSQSTSTGTPIATASSNKPPPLIFGNATTTDTPNVEKPPTFSGFNFGGEATKLNLFGNIQIPPKDNSNPVSNTSGRGGGAIKKKRSSRAGLPYDTGKPSAKPTVGESSKEADKTSEEIKAPAPVFSGFNFGTSTSSAPPMSAGNKKAEENPVFSGFNFDKPLSKSPIVEEGPKETEKTFDQTRISKPVFPGFDFSKAPPPKSAITAETTEEPSRKNPFAGFSFYSSGSEDSAKDDSTKDKATKETGTTSSDDKNVGEIKKTPTLTFGSIKPVEQPEGSSSNPGFTFGGLSSQTSDNSKSTGVTSTPPFTFGSTSTNTAPKEASKAPTFGFGSTTSSSDKSQEPSKTPLFGFGTTPSDKSKEADKAPGFGFGSLATFTDKSKEANKPLSFTFGGSTAVTKEKSKETSKPFGSSFGSSATTGDKSNEKSNTPAFSFGNVSSSDKSKEASTVPGFAFGTNTTFTDKSKEATKPSELTFGSSISADKSKDTNKASPFAFGSAPSSENSKETTKAPAFSFGSPSSKGKESTKAPSFSFGNAGETAKEASKAPSFSFGSAGEAAKEAVKTPTFSFGSAGEAAKEAAKTPTFSFGSNATESSSDAISKISAFNFGGTSTSSDKSKDSGLSPIFKFGSSETSAPKMSFGPPSVSQNSNSGERSNKKKRQLDSDEEDGPPASKKGHFNFQIPSAASPSTPSNTKKRQLDNEEETPSSNKKISTGFITPLAGSKIAFGDKTKDDTSKDDNKENECGDFAFGASPEDKERKASAAPITEEPATSSDILPKSANSGQKKPSPLSKVVTFAANSKSTASKPTGSVATAFSKKEAVENQTLNVRPVKLISSELSAEIGTLKSDMISFSDEVLQTRFWQLSPDVQQNMTLFDAFVNAQIDSFKRFEKRTQSDLKDTLTAATEKIKTLSMDTDTLSKTQLHVTDDVEAFKKRVELQKRNINAAKDFKTQKNEYLQERDERINWEYVGHIADEMESRVKEYQQIIPSIEESILNMKDDTTPSVSDINNIIDDHGIKLVKLAGRVVNIRDDIQFVRLTSFPPH